LMGIILKLLIKSLFPDEEKPEDSPTLGEAFQDRSVGQPPTPGGGVDPSNRGSDVLGGHGGGGGTPTIDPDPNQPDVFADVITPELVEILAGRRRRRLGSRANRAYIGGGGGGHIRKGPGF